MRILGKACVLGIIGLLLTSVIVSGQATHPCKNKWWQREIPQPSYNQYINPKYVEKKRELEIYCDEYNELIEVITHYIKMGQKPTALIEALEYKEKRIKYLEHELKSIPMYITKTPE